MKEEPAALCLECKEPVKPKAKPSVMEIFKAIAALKGSLCLPPYECK